MAGSLRSPSRATRRAPALPRPEPAGSRVRRVRRVRSPRSHGEVVVERVKSLPHGHGFDALKGAYGDMFEKGIVDAAKVTRSALQNAASIAAMVLTTETLITDILEKKQAVPDNGGPALVYPW